jgi:hypothetical protein
MTSLLNIKNNTMVQIINNVIKLDYAAIAMAAKIEASEWDQNHQPLENAKPEHNFTNGFIIGCEKILEALNDCGLTPSNPNK